MSTAYIAGSRRLYPSLARPKRWRPRSKTSKRARDQYKRLHPYIGDTSPGFSFDNLKQHQRRTLQLTRAQIEEEAEKDPRNRSLHDARIKALAGIIDQFGRRNVYAILNKQLRSGL